MVNSGQLLSICDNFYQERSPGPDIFQIIFVDLDAAVEGLRGQLEDARDLLTPARTKKLEREIDNFSNQMRDPNTHWDLPENQTPRKTFQAGVRRIGNLICAGVVEKVSPDAMSTTRERFESFFCELAEALKELEPLKIDFTTREFAELRTAVEQTVKELTGVVHSYVAKLERPLTSIDVNEVRNLVDRAYPQANQTNDTFAGGLVKAAKSWQEFLKVVPETLPIPSITSVVQTYDTYPHEGYPHRAVGGINAKKEQFEQDLLAIEQSEVSRIEELVKVSFREKEALAEQIKYLKSKSDDIGSGDDALMAKIRAINPRLSRKKKQAVEAFTNLTPILQGISMNVQVRGVPDRSVEEAIKGFADGCPKLLLALNEPFKTLTGGDKKRIRELYQELGGPPLSEDDTNPSGNSKSGESSGRGARERGYWSPRIDLTGRRGPTEEDDEDEENTRGRGGGNGATTYQSPGDEDEEPSHNQPAVNPSASEQEKEPMSYSDAIAYIQAYREKSEERIKRAQEQLRAQELKQQQERQARQRQRGQRQRGLDYER